MEYVSQAGDILGAVSQVVGGAAMLAALFGKPATSGWLSKARAVLDVVAFNIGNARNK